MSSTFENDPVAWIAEDDLEMLDVLTYYLGTRGFRVEAFTDGEELTNALWYLFELGCGDAPDLVITDVFMPGQNGLDVMATLRRGDWQIPIIVITGAPSPEVEEEAQRLGAIEVLEKPFDMRRLGTLASLSV